MKFYGHEATVSAIRAPRLPSGLSDSVVVPQLDNLQLVHRWCHHTHQARIGYRAAEA
jgi:hypothetical protein